MSEALFDVAELPAAPPRHPLNGMPLRGDNETCGTCAFSYPAPGGSRYYWKCLKWRYSHGRATDLRLKWPACSLWQEGDVDP